MSKDNFYDYVLPYASVNEARNNWRPLLADKLTTLVANESFTARSSSEAAMIINNNMWEILGGIVFMSEQTPLIYDPMSTIAFGYASCTGISLLFVDALRSVGVAARLVGTPAWNGQVQNGNHNWVEILDDEGEWSFIEGLPAGGGETLTNPCDKWFCNPSRMANGTQFFATRWNADAIDSQTVYPMAWDVRNRAVPGVDRSAYYQSACNQC